MKDAAQTRGGAVFNKIRLGCVMGFAMDRLWVYIVFYSIAIYSSGGGVRDVLEYAFMNKMLSIAAMTVSLLVLSLLITALRSGGFLVARSIPFTASAAAAMTLGTAMLLVPSLHTEHGALLALSAGLTGLGSGALFLCYLSSFVRVGSRMAIVEMGLGCGVAFLIAFVAVMLPPCVPFALAVLAPPASAALLLASTHNKGASTELLEETAQGSGADRHLRPFRPLFAKLFAGLSLMGVLQGFYDMFFGGTLEAATLFYNCALFAVALVAIVLVVFISVMSLPNMTTNIYKVAISLVTLGCLLTGLLGANSIYASSFFFAGYITFILLITGLCIELSNNLGTPPLVAAGIAFFALYVGEFAGTALAEALFAVAPQLPGDILLMLAFAVLIADILYLFTEKDLAALGLVEDPRLAGAAPATQEAPVAERKEQRPSVAERIGQEYGLSAREMDVLPLVLSGRTVARITEMLYISAGTVSTHIRHIYRKVGVNSKQELIDLAERMAAEQGD